jgi:hypothetical protein
MSITLADAERELGEAKAELDKTQAQIISLNTRASELVGVVNGWTAIIAAKRKGNKGTPEAEKPDAFAGIVASLPPVPVNEVDDDDSEEGENKTQFVRDQIRANAAAGMSPADLKKAAKAVGMAHPPSWPYGPLQRLKKGKEIVKRKGRFYPGPGKGELALMG